MGLFGGGNSTSTVNAQTYNFEGTSSNEADQAGAAGSSSLVIAPQIIGGGTIGDISPAIYNAPIYLTPSVNTGDAAVAAAQQTAQDALTASAPNASTLGSTLSSLFSGSNLYWILGALVVIMLARGHAGRF
jgi:hypothetical protein